MLNKNFKKALKIIAKRLEENSIKWALIGSTNMAIQGMNVKPHDLDIVMELESVNKTTNIFSDYNASTIRKLKPMTDEPGWEVKAKIEGVDIQILGEKSSGEYVRKFLSNNIIKIKFDGIEIPCFTLEAEAQAYLETNRKHKSDLIKEFLKHKE